MTQRALELGVTQSSFLDVSGIQDSSQTTASDLLKIALAAQRNELYMQLTSTLRYKLSDGTTIKNRNELISSNTYYNAACKGMTAGSTARAGNVIGGGDFARERIIPDCVRAALQKRNMIVRNPHSTRPYQHVLEPVFTYLMIAEMQ